MGFHIIDSHTFSHFFFGFICKLVIFSNIPLYSFIISNGIHLIVEINEHNYDNNNKQLESFTNHLGDVIAFFIGWYLCYYFNYNLSSKKKLDVFLKYFLLSKFLLDYILKHLVKYIHIIKVIYLGFVKELLQNNFIYFFRLKA